MNFTYLIGEVHMRIQNSTTHTIYIHNSCHRLKPISIQVASSIKETRMFFEALNSIQAVLGFSELKIVKLSDTRWLSHERCFKVICKEPPPLLQSPFTAIRVIWRC